MHWYHSMSTGDWLLMTFFWILLIALLVWAIVGIFGRPDGHQRAKEQPEEILDRRLARGEIDAATYDALRNKLHRAH